MFNKTIFKHTIKANWVLWLIFTTLLCAMMALMVGTHDPMMIKSMTKALEGTAIAEMAGDRLSAMTTLLGALGTSFYGMVAILLPLIYVIIVSNSLVASEVDRGSMAYTLSTPIKRKSVIFTKAIALVGALVLMISLISVTGIVTAQAKFNAIWGTNYTADVKAIAKDQGKDNADVKANLNAILTDENATKIGAKARSIDEDVYKTYLALVVARDAGTTQEQTMTDEQKTQMQDKMTKGLKAAADVLDVDVASLASDMGKIKGNDAALTAASTAAELPKETFVGIINAQLAADEISIDEGVAFNVGDFLMLNLGLFLLIFAISSISFLASSAANLTKFSLTFGAGIPVAFEIFKIIAQTSDSLSTFKYFTLTTLFNSEAIAAGTIEVLPLIALGVIGIVLYFCSIQVFKKKDLPL